MKLFNILLTIVVLTLFTGCTTSKSTIASNADIAKYQYVSVINNDTYRIPAPLMEYQIQLFDAVEASGLQLVNDMNIYNLTPSQQSKLLLAKYAVNTKDEETVVTVSFIDFNSGRPIASCRGTYSTLGFSQSTDIRKAIENVGKQISQTFGKVR